jgi:preprotein translocase subunit SecF
VELFKHVSVDWLSKKWWFFSFSCLLIVLGAAGYFLRGGMKYGIDFTGGTIILMKFNEMPELDRIRELLSRESQAPPLIQRYDAPSMNMVQVRIQSIFEGAENLEAGRERLLAVFRKEFDPGHAGSELKDFNNVGLADIFGYLHEADPDNLAAKGEKVQDIERYYQDMALRLKDYRDKDCEGLVPALGDLKAAAGISGETIAGIEKGFFAGPFAVKGHESVGAIAGADLRYRATLAVLFSFAGMLIYVAFRFKLIYGVAAVIALIHDLVITLGLFAVTNKEISLTVIAALLTLVGYSMNDTIVIFDRVRENLKLGRKESITRIINLSINQVFSRTVMTSGTTFFSVLALLVLGGEVLNGFSFALTIGIIVGTYSSFGIAGPIVEWWYRTLEKKPKGKAA